MSPESSEPSSVPTHTTGTLVVTEKANGWPSEPEVIKHAKTYPGNLAIGIPAGAISDVWASNYWAWRTFNKEHWPERWPEEMFRRFAREWEQGVPAVRRDQKKNPARGATTGLSANVVAIQTSSRVRELAGQIRALEDEVHQNRASNMPFDPKQMRQLQELRAELDAARPSEEKAKS